MVDFGSEYVNMNVKLHIVELKVCYLCYCRRCSAAASDTAVPLGQRPISEAAQVTVELSCKFSATWHRYGKVLYRDALERLLLFNRELLD
jgi:hypothetical protein